MTIVYSRLPYHQDFEGRGTSYTAVYMNNQNMKHVQNFRYIDQIYYLIGDWMTIYTVVIPLRQFGFRHLFRC